MRLKQKYLKFAVLCCFVLLKFLVGIVFPQPIQAQGCFTYSYHSCGSGISGACYTNACINDGVWETQWYYLDPRPLNECLGCSASCFFATVYCGNVCGGCDSSGGGDDDTAPPRGKFGVSFFYDADRDGNWDAEESALSVNHASVRNSIVTVLNIPGFRLYNYQGLSIENNVCLENTAANCTDRGDSACVCPNVDETCGVVHRPRKQYVTSGNVYWTCDGNDSSPRTLYSEGYHWVRAATGNNCIGQEICVWRAQGLGLSTNNLDVLAGPEIGGGNPSVSFQFNLPGGWETTRIKWNTSYYPSNNVGSQILTSNEGVTSISTNLEDAGSIAARYKIVGRIIHVGVVEDVNPPQVISVSPNNASICTGDNRSFTTTYSDADGAADIAHAQLNIVDSSVQSGDNHVPAYWYTRASLKLDENPPRFFFWGPLEEGATRPSSPAVWRNNRWELNTPLRSASNRAELNAVNSEIPGSGTYAVLSGNNVVVNWDINFDSDYYPGPGNYPRTHNLLLWVFDDAGLEDERNLNLIEIQHPSWHPPPDGVNDFHDMGNLTVQNCVANVVGTAYNASIYSNTTIACSNRSSLTRVGGIVIACNEYGVGADCGVPDSRTSAPAPDGSYSFIGLPLADNYNFQATVGGSGFNEVNFCSSESLSTYVTLDASGATEDLVAFQGVNESWWQAEIGDVHANGAGIRSEIPAACGYGSFDYCIPYILKNSDTIPPQEGLVTYSDGTVDYGEGDGEAESEWVANSSYNGGQRGYDYFWRLARDEEFNDDWSNSPSGSLYSLSEDVSINTAWSAFDGITVVYIGGENDEDIDYDLEINENITLDTDGFVAFIVSGDVTIAEDVTEIQAVIIADGTITVEGNGSDDFQFHGTGSFVSWSGFNFYRNLGMNGLGRDNRGDPAELFTYDPNIIRLAPDVLKRATYSWIEVAP